MKLSILDLLCAALLAAVAQAQQPAFTVTAPTPPSLPAHFIRHCAVSPLGAGNDDTAQVIAAMTTCSKSGNITLAPGTYNINQKMTWTLNQTRVNMHGAILNFKPDVTFWLDPANTYRAVVIQSQASWFIITGKDFLVDAGGTGGIQGNGQVWYNTFATTRKGQDGDGRPVSLSVVNATKGIIRGFRIEQQPLWCNAVSMSQDILYDGMHCNATNTNPQFARMNVVPNTDGLDIYRSKRIALQNWDITSGDDCLAIKGNSTNIRATGVICRGGNGIAIGSLGQYIQFNDLVENMIIENVQLFRLPANIQPNLAAAIYFKTWTGTAHGVPPIGGGGGGGLVSDILARNFTFDPAGGPVHLTQVNNGQDGDAPSTIQFQNMMFEDFQGSGINANLVNLKCSPAAPCTNIVFSNFNVNPPAGATANYTCLNVVGESGLPFCTPNSSP